LFSSYKRYSSHIFYRVALKYIFLTKTAEKKRKQLKMSDVGFSGCPPPSKINGDTHYENQNGNKSTTQATCPLEKVAMKCLR